MKKQAAVYALNNGTSHWVRDTGYDNSGYPPLSAIDYSVRAQYVPMTGAGQQPVAAGQDTLSAQKYMVDVVQGSIWIDGGVCASAEACAGETREIYANVPEG